MSYCQGCASLTRSLNRALSDLLAIRQSRDEENAARERAERELTLARPVIEAWHLVRSLIAASADLAAARRALLWIWDNSYHYEVPPVEVSLAVKAAQEAKKGNGNG